MKPYLRIKLTVDIHRGLNAIFPQRSFEFPEIGNGFGCKKLDHTQVIGVALCRKLRLVCAQSLQGKDRPDSGMVHIV